MVELEQFILLNLTNLPYLLILVAGTYLAIRNYKHNQAHSILTVVVLILFAGVYFIPPIVQQRMIEAYDASNADLQSRARGFAALGAYVAFFRTFLWVCLLVLIFGWRNKPNNNSCQSVAKSAARPR